MIATKKCLHPAVTCVRLHLCSRAFRCKIIMHAESPAGGCGGLKAIYTDYTELGVERDMLCVRLSDLLSEKKKSRVNLHS